jgi:2-dehydro-3-deoxygluconokinase
MTDLITFGETMLRLSPPHNQLIEQVDSLDLKIGGTESTVAVNISRLGKKTAWFSRLPNTPLGRKVSATLQQQGVDTSAVIWDEDHRMGLYFVEFGVEPRPTRVWYDRANSAAAQMSPRDLPAGQIKAARWLHVTGITPALSDTCAETVIAAVQYAKEQNTTVSLDVNYRAKLWSSEQAAKFLAPLCQQADVVLTAHRDAQLLFGADDDPKRAIQSLQQQWGGKVFITQGDIGAYAHDGNGLAYTDAYAVRPVDRLGAGDAFAAGVIFSLLEKQSLQDAVKFGTALAALKLTIPGDLALFSRQDVETLIESGVSGSPSR